MRQLGPEKLGGLLKPTELPSLSVKLEPKSSAFSAHFIPPCFFYFRGWHHLKRQMISTKCVWISEFKQFLFKLCKIRSSIIISVLFPKHFFLEHLFHFLCAAVLASLLGLSALGKADTTPNLRVTWNPGLWNEWNLEFDSRMVYDPFRVIVSQGDFCWDSWGRGTLFAGTSSSKGDWSQELEATWWLQRRPRKGKGEMWIGKKLNPKDVVWAPKLIHTLI